MLLQWAHYYASLNWPVFPLHSYNSQIQKCTCGNDRCKSPGKHPLTPNGVKNATTNPQNIESWWRQWPWANIGICTDNIFVIDIDVKNGKNGFNSLSGLCNGNGNLPETLTSETGSKGQHLFYTLPPGIQLNNKTNFADGIDFRAKGGYVVAPPSVNNSGPYRFLKMSQIAQLPQWFIDLVQKPQFFKGIESAKLKNNKNLIIPNKIPIGQRDALVTQFIGQWIGLGLDYDSCFSRAITILLPIVEQTPDDPFTVSDIERILNSIAKKDTTEHGKFYRFTDQGNVERLIDQYGDFLRYSPRGLGSGWLSWNGKHWQDDSISLVSQAILDLIKQMHLQALDLRNNGEMDRSAVLSKWAFACESRKNQNAIIELAQRQLPFRNLEGLDIFDQHNWKLNCNNCTLDLENLTQYQHKKEDYFTKILNYDYDPAAQCPRWLQFLKEVFVDPELIAYIQQFVGYCLTGDISEHSFWIFYGTGANGKSTFIETINALLGSYALTVPFHTFHYSDHDTIPNDLARMKGARFVSANEGKKGHALNENLLKSLSGGDRLSVRFLHREFFEMVPTFKIVLASNHQHPLFGQDYGLWRRLKYIPFTQCFSGDSEDRMLKPKLLMELPGILNWAIEGLRQWRATGRLVTPTIIQNATTLLKTELDTTGMFLDDCCILDSNAYTTTKELDQAYESWYREEFSLSHNERMPQYWQKNLKDDLKSKSHTLTRYRTNEGIQKRGWSGFRIIKKHLSKSTFDNIAQNPIKNAQKTL